MHVGQILLGSLTETRIEIRRMGGDPREFRRKQMIQLIRQQNRKENAISWQDFVFESIIFANGSICTPFNFIVVFGVKKFMALGIAELPQIVDNHPAGPYGSEQTNGSDAMIKMMLMAERCM